MPITDEKFPQPRRVTLRLTPYQARRLWELRTEGLDGKTPRTVTEVLIRALSAAVKEELPNQFPDIDKISPDVSEEKRLRIIANREAEGK